MCPPNAFGYLDPVLVIFVFCAGLKLGVWLKR